MVSKFSGCLVKEKKLLTLCMHASLKTVNKDCYESRIKISVSGFPLLSLVNFLQCTCHIRLSEKISDSQAAFGTTFRVTGGYLGNKLPEEGYWGDFQN
jgi:hypothetical protein